MLYLHVDYDIGGNDGGLWYCLAFILRKALILDSTIIVGSPQKNSESL